MTVECVVVFVSGDVGHDRLQVYGRLVERLSLAGNAGGVLAPVAGVFVIVKRSVHIARASDWRFSSPRVFGLSASGL